MEEVDGSKISEHEVALLREQIWRMRHPGAAMREALWPHTCVPREKALADVGTERIYEWESGFFLSQKKNRLVSRSIGRRAFVNEAGVLLLLPARKLLVVRRVVLAALDIGDAVEHAAGEEEQGQRLRVDWNLGRLVDVLAVNAPQQRERRHRKQEQRYGLQRKHKV